MVRHTPTVKVAKMMHVMMMIGVEVVVSPILCAILEGAVVRGGAKDVEMGLIVEGGFVLFIRKYPLIQNIEFLLFHSLAPLECI